MKKAQRSRRSVHQTRTVSSTPRSRAAEADDEDEGTTTLLLSPVEATRTRSSGATRTTSSSFVTRSAEYGSSSDGYGSLSEEYTTRSEESVSSSGRFERQQDERKELVGLNDRLARYIDEVTKLWVDGNRALLNESSIFDWQSGLSGAIEEIRLKYETELADARRLHAADRDRLERECGKYKTTIHELNIRVQSLEKRCSDAEKRVPSLESQLVEKENRIRQLEAELNRLEPDVTRLERELRAARKEVENGNVIRIQLEARIKELEKDMQVQKETYELEIEELRGKWNEELPDIINRTFDEFTEELMNSSLFDDLQNVRKRELKQDTRLVEFRSLVERLRGAAVGDFASELRKLKVSLGVKDQNDALLARIMDLEKQLRREQEEHCEKLASREKELQELKMTVKMKIQEYNELLEIKLRLDQEIATYRKLLEGGEARLRRKHELSEAITSPRGGQRVSRRRMDDERQITKSSTTNGVISIVQSDGGGNFIKLHNLSEQDQSLGGWHLQQTIDGEVGSTYSFSSRFKLKADAMVTVWASGSSDKVHRPPSDIVCRDVENWGSGDSVEAMLLDESEEVVATLSMTKELVYQTGDSDHYPPSGRRFEPCSVM